MRNLFLLLALTCLFARAHAQGQCPPGTNEFRLDIDPDMFYWEVSWKVKSPLTGDILLEGVLPDDLFHSFTYCVDTSQCVQFQINDSNDDGIFSEGSYQFYLNGDLVMESPLGANFGRGDTIFIGCKPGTYCDSAIPVDTGSWVTPTGAQTWYRFTPADTGVYHINTCDPNNACPTKIWVYSTCRDIILTESIAGAVLYAEDGCDNGALLPMRMAGGEEYLIRIRSNPAGCDSVPIHFSIKLDHLIKGCQDSTSCNYDPLATLLEPCLPFGDPNCWTSDLIIDEFVLRNSMVLETTENNDPCYVLDGCLRGVGTRHTLTFATKISNIGISDYLIGYAPPPGSMNTDQFTWDLCHKHWHLNGYVEYLLYDTLGNRIPIGTKPGFCLVDYLCPPGIKKYNCTYMGITAGCSDIYNASTICQWVDITDIPAGDYKLVVRVNWQRKPDKLGREEASYDNNWAQACFNLSYPNNIPLVEFYNDVCPPVVDCAGVLQGNAQPDCNGVCNGPALHGDWNQDTLQTVEDIFSYMQHAVADDGAASPCNDLNGDGTIDVFDGALLQECILHKDSVTYWNQRFPCLFPTGFDNPQELVTLRLGDLDTLQKTLVVQIANPYNSVMGYEFSVSGIVIDSIVNLYPDYTPEIRFNNLNGEIVGLSLTETVAPKNAFPVDLLRIHYSQATKNQACLEKVSAIVNGKYQGSNGVIGQPNCLATQTSATTQPDTPTFRVFVQPNPFRTSTTLYFENDRYEAVQVTISDLTGKVVQQFDNLHQSSLSISNELLAPGAYIFTVRTPRGSVSGKLMAQ